MSFDDLDAPQYSNFEDYDQEGAEQYFEIDHESDTIKERKLLQECVPKEDSLNVNNYNPINTNSPLSEEGTNTLELRNRIVKRSSSCENVSVATESVSKMCLKSDEKERIEEHDVRNHTQFNYGSLRKGNSVSQSKMRYCSQESLNRLAIPKKIYSSTSDIALSSNEYVSMAEAVRKFHEKTPSRFHTQNKNNKAPKNATYARLKATIPMSPNLLTKKRIKVNEAIISHEEKMQMEFEKEQNFKIKANPINKKILQPMKAVHLEKKPPTVPEPFKLTKKELKKAASPRKDEYQFRAKLMPKSIKEPPKLPKKLGTKLTEPVTPSFMRKQSKPSSPKKEVEKPPSQVLKTTKPEPFSFEKRNQLMMKKKEEKLKKIEDEEKKAREFHARPIPHSIANLIMKQKQKSIDDGYSSPNVSASTKDQCQQQFKARPPKVLHQKPFEPKKVDQPLTEIKPFNFNSEARAIEREMFENKKKEMEKIAAMLLEEEEQQKIDREEEERKRIREETKFKAQPIRNFKGVIIEPSCKVTEPVSPIFLSGKSNRKNKENEM